jgi:hypothetical protein
MCACVRVCVMCGQVKWSSGEHNDRNNLRTQGRACDSKEESLSLSSYSTPYQMHISSLIARDFTCVNSIRCRRVCPRNTLTNSVQQSPSLNASSSSDIQAVNCISWYLKVYYLGQWTQQPSLSWAKWIKSAVSHPISSKIHFNIVLLFKLMSSNWAVPWEFSYQIIICISCFGNMFHKSPPMSFFFITFIAC